MSVASARGLFRATGKSPRPTVQMLDGGLVRVDAGLEREKDDFYPTPPEPTRALVAHGVIPDDSRQHVLWSKPVWVDTAVHSCTIIIEPVAVPA